MCHCTGVQRTQILTVPITSKQTKQSKKQPQPSNTFNQKLLCVRALSALWGLHCPWLPHLPGPHLSPRLGPQTFPKCALPPRWTLDLCHSSVSTRLQLHFLFLLARQTPVVACFSTCCGAVTGPSHPCGVVPGLMKGCGP